MSNYRRQLGDWGEELALKYLEKIGYKILDQKWQTREGEIDLIALDQGTFVFIEVKTRRSNRFGYPAEAISKNKQSKIIKCIESYLVKNHLAQNIQIRLDVILIKLDKNKAQLQHLKNPVENCS